MLSMIAWAEGLKLANYYPISLTNKIIPVVHWVYAYRLQCTLCSLWWIGDKSYYLVIENQIGLVNKLNIPINLV